MPDFHFSHLSESSPYLHDDLLLDLGENGKLQTKEASSEKLSLGSHMLQKISPTLIRRNEAKNNCIMMAYLNQIHEQSGSEDLSREVFSELQNHFTLGKPLRIRDLRNIGEKVLVSIAIGKAKTALEKSPVDTDLLNQASLALDIARDHLSPRTHAKALYELQIYSDKVDTCLNKSSAESDQEDRELFRSALKEIQWVKKNQDGTFSDKSVREDYIRNIKTISKIPDMVTKYTEKYQSSIKNLFTTMHDSGAEIDELISLLEKISMHPDNLAAILTPKNRALLLKHQQNITAIFQDCQTSISMKEMTQISADDLLPVLEGAFNSDSVTSYSSIERPKIHSRISALLNAIYSALEYCYEVRTGKQKLLLHEDGMTGENFLESVKLLERIFGSTIGVQAYSRNTIASICQSSPIMLASTAKEFEITSRQEVESNFLMPHSEESILDSNAETASVQTPPKSGLFITSEFEAVSEDLQTLADQNLKKHPNGYRVPQAISYRENLENLKDLNQRIQMDIGGGQEGEPLVPSESMILVIGDDSPSDQKTTNELFEKIAKDHGLTQKSQIRDLHLHLAITNQLSDYPLHAFRKATSNKSDSFHQTNTSIEKAIETRTIVPDPKVPGSFFITIEHDLSSTQLTNIMANNSGNLELRKVNAPKDQIFHGRYALKLKMTFDLEDATKKPTIEAIECKGLMTLDKVAEKPQFVNTP